MASQPAARLLFLDIDGVLNSTEWFQKKPTPKKRTLDPRCVELVNQICQKTDCQIVISSSWRVGIRPVYLLHLLQTQGLKGFVVGTTPRTLDDGLLEFPNRGYEIAAWLQKNASRKNVESFVILDNRDDMGELKNFLVQTSDQIGITEGDAAKAIEILGEHRCPHSPTKNEPR